MTTHYIFVRKDLPVGILAAMVTHAAGESAAYYKNINGHQTGLPEHTTAVVLEAIDEAHLTSIRAYLLGKGLEEGLQMFTIIESGGAYDGQFMAIGLLPWERELISPYLSTFKLLNECKETFITEE